MADVSLHITGPVVDLLKELEAVRQERDALRIIASDHLAGSNFTVKPEDAADVAKWAANPGAVRELLRCARYTEDEEDPACCDCGAFHDQSHSRTQLLNSPGKPWRDCTIAAAWRALGDPRGAADIEQAHEQAMRQQATRRMLRHEGDPRFHGVLAARALEPEAVGLFAGLPYPEANRHALEYARSLACDRNRRCFRIRGHDDECRLIEESWDAAAAVREALRR